MSETFQTTSAAQADLVEAAAHSIVTVEGRRRHPATGVIWSNDGIIVTANHVVERDDNLYVTLPGAEALQAELVGRDPGADLAVLRIASGNTGGDAKPAAWSAPDDLRVGHFVLALGRPGADIQATLGVISGLGGPWRHRGGGHFDQYIQTDVTMYPGFSGGPLLTAWGTFAGLNSSALARGVSLTIPTVTVEKTVNTLLTHGHIPRAYLGVGVQPVQLQPGTRPDTEQETGLMVMSVESDSPAGKAGILQGDILVRIQDQPLRQADDLQQWLIGQQAGSTVTLHILRGGTPQTQDVELGVR